jgi:enamine deaminase RidA (YjgF/YER057c/UK114 family)
VATARSGRAEKAGADVSVESNSSAVQRYDPFEGGLGFALATRVGNLVYTSGMVGVDGDLNVPEDPGDEIRLIFQNLAGVLEAMGTSFDHVVDLTEFVAGDIEVLWPVLEEVRKEVFRGRLPASTCVGVNRLLDERYHVEVKLVAAVPEI